MREDDIIKAGLGLIAGYFIADFLSPKGWSGEETLDTLRDKPKSNKLHPRLPGDLHHKYNPGGAELNDRLGVPSNIDPSTAPLDPFSPISPESNWKTHRISGRQNNRISMAYQGDIADQSGDQFNFRSNTLPTYVARQGYVFGQGHGQQRHQWDFMPHSLGPRRAYQGVLGVDYTLACSDQSVANSAGQCANGTRAVVSPISQPPPPVTAPAPTPVTTPLIPTSSDSGLPVSATTPDTTTPAATVTTPVPVVTTPTPVVTTPTPVPVVTTPTPVVTTPTFPQHPTSNNPHDWQQWAQQFRTDLREDFRQLNRRGSERGNEWGRGSGWAFQRSGRRAYQATASTQTSNQAVLLATATPSGVHLDVHRLQPLEPVTVDLNIPLSNVSRTTNLMADSSGHLTHDYNMTRPPGKQYIAAIRITGQQSKRVGFKSLKI